MLACLLFCCVDCWWFCDGLFSYVWVGCDLICGVFAVVDLFVCLLRSVALLLYCCAVFWLVCCFVVLIVGGLVLFCFDMCGLVVL